MSDTPDYLDDYFEFLRFAGISTDPGAAGALQDTATWVCERLKRAGLDAEIRPSAGQPVVIGKNEHKPGRPTVLIYGHYDVQPCDPLDLWKSPPFEPVLRDGFVYARGSSDNKGQILAHIVGVERQLRRDGELPVNVTFLIEGEEEIGSPNLMPFVEQHKADLACDTVVISDSSVLAQGVPTFSYALRGIIGLEFTLRGPDRDLHSGMFGGAITNPLTAMARLVATLHACDGSVAVKGFYEAVRPIADWEREAWSKLGLNDEELRRMSGAPALAPEQGYSGYECIWARPTIEPNGMWGGFQGKGTKTVLPSEAHCKITCRLVPDQDPHAIYELVAQHLRDNCPETMSIEITKGHAGEPYYVDPNEGFGAAAKRALHRAFPDKDTALIREGGSIPITNEFKKVLGVDTLLLPLCLPDCNAHSPNESFPLSQFEMGIALNETLLQEIAAAG